MENNTAGRVTKRLKQRAYEIEYNKQYQRTYKNTGKGTYGRYKYRAKEKGLIFELTFEEFASLIYCPCHYCGTVPVTRNGIDRKDNGQGYTLANSLPACKRCNYAKNDMGYDEFISHLKKILNNLAI